MGSGGEDGQSRFAAACLTPEVGSGPSSAYGPLSSPELPLGPGERHAVCTQLFSPVPGSEVKLLN